MKCRCNLCGKFRKTTDVMEMSGDSDDTGYYETWLECKHCMSEFDLLEYLSRSDKANLSKELK